MWITFIALQMWVEDEGLASYWMSIKLNEATKSKRSFWSQNAATDRWHMPAK